MKKSILYFILFIITAPVFSQSAYTIQEAIQLYKMDKIMTGQLNSELLASDIKGSPYLNDEFTSGTVFTTSKVQYNNVNLRYNIYSDNVEFEAEGQVLEFAAPEIVEKITFGDYTIQYLPFSISKKIRNGFFILLEEGKASLFVRPEVSFEKATLPGAYKDAEPAKFVRKSDTYYIRIEKNEAKTISNQKDLPNIFTDNMDKMNEFVKKEKLRLNREDDLKKLVNFYNSL